MPCRPKKLSFLAVVLLKTANDHGCEIGSSNLARVVFKEGNCFGIKVKAFLPTWRGHLLMKDEPFRLGLLIHTMRRLVALICTVTLVLGDTSLFALQDSAQATPTAEAASVPPEQLDSLVAPIALYPDPLLSQTLVAATYPLEVIQLQQWLEKNKNLKDKA